MKWYNKDKTRFLETDQVGYWDYFPSNKADGFQLGSALFVVIGGREIKFFNEEAEELYNMLINQKDLLHS